MINENELLWLDPNDSESVYQVAQLHKELLTDSPIPKLGDLFMTEFYYKRRISADLINSLVYKHNSIVANNDYHRRWSNKKIIKINSNIFKYKKLEE